jgi:hypothetical protein
VTTDLAAAAAAAAAAGVAAVVALSCPFWTSLLLTLLQTPPKAQ